MTTNSAAQSNQKKIKNFNKVISSIPFIKISRQSGFQKRKPKKIHGKELLTSFFIMISKNVNSLNHWARCYYKQSNQIISKQAIWKRINGLYVRFLSKVLQYALAKQIEYCPSKEKKNLFRRFKRVLLQDSTHIKLPISLKKIFPGNSSQNGQYAVCKLQVVFDLLSHCFVSYKLTPSIKNDQSESSAILNITKEGDLIIRDLGYFKLDCFRQLIERKIDFVSRCLFSVSFFDAKTFSPINLLKILRRQNGFDAWVLAGDKEKLKIRLVAIPLPKKKAAERIRKAKKSIKRQGRSAYGKAYIELLKYCIFITSVGVSEWTPKNILQVYGYRWRIETIFKCWKSNFHIEELMTKQYTMTQTRAEATMYAVLIFITLFHLRWYNFFLWKIYKKTGRFISITKLSLIINVYYSEIFNFSIQTMEQIITRYCLHDAHKNRKNYVESLILS